MKTSIKKQKGLQSVIFVFLIILGISFITSFYKELFVHSTGNIKIFGSTSILLGIGLLLKWKYSREILTMITFFGIMGMAFVVFNSASPYIIPNTILLISLVVLFYLLWISNSIKGYIENN